MYGNGLRPIILYQFRHFQRSHESDRVSGGVAARNRDGTTPLKQYSPNASLIALNLFAYLSESFSDSSKLSLRL